ncbi:hypothetical protein DdX_07588 [Ditylenchus destructor]|uniref:Protein sleepless n=1 Tax=Ditylenchus destructor TaxID=166010 RepID=A0AAD4N4G6_9BILA|nr:hypothetical protein DdX_07588 [Ditylenchus destructor]
MNLLLFLFFSITITLIMGTGEAIVCYDCDADDATCDTGECYGATCLKMETSYLDNERRRTVNKGCSDEYEETQCKQTAFGSKLITRCTCDTDYCNGEKRLVAAGFPASSKHKLLLSPLYVLINAERGFNNYEF